MRVPEIHSFPPSMKVYPTPNCDILGAPIGTADHCDEWVTNKAIAKTRKLLPHLDKLETPIMPTCFFGTASLSLAWYFFFVQFLLITYLEPVTRSTEL